MVEEPHDSAVAQHEGENGTPQDETAAQPSMVVGKIPPGEGLWGALEAITTCDGIRNGVLVVFSREISGRLGVFCNRYITGAVIDSSPVTGLKALKRLLSVSSGMFCFRSCFGGETAELGQGVSLDITEVLQVRAEDRGAAPPSEAVHQLTASRTTGTLADNYLADVVDSPLESALIVTSSGESLTESVPVYSAAADNFTATDELADQPESKEAGEYLDWFEKQDKESGNLNLRRILLPVFEKRPGNEESETRSQMSRDLNLYAEILKQEEEKVKRDIEKTLERSQGNANVQQTLNDMKLLADLLHSQEEMIQTRWQGLDDIPTPRVGAPTHFDSSGAMRTGAPVRSSKEFLIGCADLINQSTKPTDPREFLKKGTSESQSTKHFWLNHPRVFAVGVLAIFGLIVFAVSLQLTISSVSSCLKEGKEHLRAQRWSDAILAFSDALGKDPNCGQAYFYRGIAYEENGDDKRAESDFKAARDHGVPAAQVAVAQAAVEVRREQWQKVIDICNHAGDIKSAALFELRANAALHLGDFAEAKDNCDTALSLCGKDDAEQRAQILASRGYARMQLRDFDGGSKDFDEAIGHKPEASLYLLKGDACRKAKRFPEAIASYNSALELDPRNYNAYVARGMCETQLHQVPQALKDFGRALALQSNGVEALIQRGSLELSTGAYRAALLDLQQAWELNPTVEETRQKLMMAYSKNKQMVPKDIMAENRASARSKLPTDPAQLVIIGYKAINEGDLDLAIDCLVDAVKKAPNNADARRYLAYAFSKAGDFEAAAKQFSALQALQTLSDDEALMYSEALVHEGQPKSAAAVLMRRLGSSPNNVQLYARLSELYYTAGMKTNGDAIAQQGLDHATTDSEKRQLLNLIKNGPATRTAQPARNATSHG